MPGQYTRLLSARGPDHLVKVYADAAIASSVGRIAWVSLLLTAA
jgi:hypothetical protein